VTKPAYSVKEARYLVTVLRESSKITNQDADVFNWLCDRVADLEKQLANNCGQIEGTCSVCQKGGWYFRDGERRRDASMNAVISLIGSTMARAITGQVRLIDKDGVLICTECLRCPT